MRLQAIAAAALLIAGCARPGAPPPAALPPPAPRGALEIRVEPNPIVAVPAGAEGEWEFPLSIAIIETGGSRVIVDRVGIDVLAIGGLKVYSTELTAAEIERRGFPRIVQPGGEVRYTMRPRQRVPDERLFTSISAELWAEGTDEGGRHIETKTRVTVRK